MKDEVHCLPVEEMMGAIERVKSGDAEFFWQLVGPYQRSLYATAYSLLRNTCDAEDVVQETMLKALKHLGQLREGQCFKSWLTKIATNEARMLRRKGVGEISYEGAKAENTEAFTPCDYADWRHIPSNALEQKEVWEAVHCAIQLLSPACREVFVLRDIRHFPVPEVAAILGISEAKVSVRLHRARLQMREFLAPLFREPPSPWVPIQMMADLSAMFHKVVSCKTALKEISKYIEEELSPHLRSQLEGHLKHCRRSKILLDTTRKLLYLVADEKVFLPPFTYNGRRALGCATLD